MVDAAAGEALAAEYGIKFIEASAKSNEGVDDAFIMLAKDIKARLIDTEAESGSGGQGASVLSGDDLAGGGEAKKESGCCK